MVLAALAACTSGPSHDEGPDTEELLRNSLPVAAAAMAAGQLDVARRLYVSLADRFGNSPAPLLGLAYVAFQSGDFSDAEAHFLRASRRAADTPATRAEALLGAGRTALAQGRTITARRHLRGARAAAGDTPPVAWIENGLAVVATLRGEFGRAESHYADAIRQSSGHPRIAANYVRMLVAAGRLDDAAQAYREHPPTWWADDDGPELSRLVEESRRELRRQALEDAEADAGDAPAHAPVARSRATASARSGGDAPQTVQSDPTLSLATPEKPDPGLPLRLLIPDLASRLDRPSATPARPDAEPLPSGEIAARDPTGLHLRLDRTSSPDASASAANGTAATMASDEVAPDPVTAVSATELTESRVKPARDAPEPSAASGPALPGPVPEPEAPVVRVLDPSASPTLALALGQSRRVHLDRNASSVLVASPEIADVQLLAPDVLYVIGKGVGRTSVAVLHDGKRVDDWAVSVVLDLEPLRVVLARESGLGDVRARRLTRGVALTGEVDSAQPPIVRCVSRPARCPKACPSRTSCMSPHRTRSTSRCRLRRCNAS